MTIARAHLVDPAVTRWYHCVTRCVRRAFLLGEGTHDRKGWIEHRLEELAEIFSVAVAGFAILDNHLHLLVRLDPDVARGWSDEDVVRRWGRLFPSPRGQTEFQVNLKLGLTPCSRTPCSRGMPKYEGRDTSALQRGRLEDVRRSL